MAYTVIQANYFMEVWLSPALGFDYASARAYVCTVRAISRSPGCRCTMSRDFAVQALDDRGDAESAGASRGPGQRLAAST
jgi:hypothetical protein